MQQGARRARRLGLATLALSLMVAAGAQARAGVSFDSDYQGHPEGDHSLYIGFNIEKSNGERRIKSAMALLPYQCRESGGGDAVTRARKSIKVKADRRFSATVPAKVLALGAKHRGAEGVTDVKLTLKGRLSKDGKSAIGTVEGDLKTPPVIRPKRRVRDIPCTTFPRHFKAKRGAETPPVND